ncbi:MAG: phosphoenolpyruvate--protein phosphotransferase [Ignavibacteriales bacterium]|nr:phosphoenolpyruvate--protein phosphotransferase [Ignavibacteriales bacterium]
MEQKTELRYQGVPAAPGIVMARAYRYLKHVPRIEEKKITPKEVDGEIERLKHAVGRAEKELQKVLLLAEQKIGVVKAKIFEAQIMILSDAVLFGAIINRIKKEHKNAEFIVHAEIAKYQQMMLASSDEYMRERSHDVEDVKNRIIRNIQEEKLVSRFEGNSIVVAQSLTPADTILFSRNEVLGYLTDMGGVTSHAALLARSLRVPAIVGLKDLTAKVETGDALILDGYAGVVVVHPTEETIRAFEQRKAEIAVYEKKLHALRDLPAETLDGKHVELSSNIEFSEEVEFVRSQGSHGVGLYRAEGMLMGRDTFPSEEEQFCEYNEIAEKAYPHKVIVRTFDIGGDKVFADVSEEENPFLGWRGIRVSLDRPESFLMQLRAILKASVKRNIWVMFPMVSSLKEVRRAKEFVAQAKASLKSEGVNFDKKIKVGVMIEVPAAAIIAGDIAKEVDFLSIGTNDLIQYLLAVDRGNELVSQLYQEFDPAVMRTIRHIIKEAHKHRIPVGMCGAMAGDPVATLLLLGLGLDEFSVIPTILPEIKKIIRSVNYKEAQKVALKAIAFSTADEVREFLTANTKRIAPEIHLKE